MIAFIFATLALFGLALAFVLPTLLRPAGAAVAPDEPAADASAPQHGLAAGLTLGLAVLLAGLYAAFGTPAGIAEPAPPPVAGAASPVSPAAAQVEAMVARLAARLQSQPDDEAGWRLLAKSYETLRRYDQADAAQAQLRRLRPRDAGLLTDYAVTLALRQGQRLGADSERLLREALAIDPDHVEALALLGSAAFDRSDYAAAVAPWRRALARLPADSPMAESLADNLAQAEARLKTAH